MKKLKLNKKEMAVNILIIFVGLLLIFMVWKKNNARYEKSNKALSINVETNQDIVLQLFYSDTLVFSEENVTTVIVEGDCLQHDIALPFNGNPKYFRIDLGDISSDIKLRDFKLCIDKIKKDLPLQMFYDSVNESDIKNKKLANDILFVEGTAPDPYIVIDCSDINFIDDYNRMCVPKIVFFNSIYTFLILLLITYCLGNIKILLLMPKDLIRNREMFFDLAKNDFYVKFQGSYLGVFWGFFQPIILLLLYWFVFQYGMRAGSIVGYPFILYLMAGLIPWFYFSESWASSTGSILEYSYLVKKVVFETNLLPIIKVVSSLIIHVFFISILLITCCLYGYYPNIYYVQLIFYLGLLIIYSIGLSYITSALNVFFRDIGQLVNVVLTIGVWFTPIMWNIDMINPSLQFIFKANPMFYIVDGFRDCVLRKEFFWNKPIWTLYTISCVVLVYILGVRLYEKLKLHFADVL